MYCVIIASYQLTKLSQRINDVLQMHPEPEPPQRDALVGHGQRQPDSAAADLLLMSEKVDVRSFKSNPNCGL